LGFLEREFSLSLKKESVTHCSPSGEFHPLVQDNWRPNGTGSVKFNHMKNLGTCPRLVSGNFKQNSQIIDPIYQAYVQETGDNSIEKLVGCTPAIHTQQRYIKSISKCDKPRLPRPDDPLWHIAGEYTRRMFDYQHNSNFSMIYDINMSSSVGKPYSSMGFKSKAELLASEIFTAEIQRCHTPIWSIFPKEEYLPFDDVVIDEKLRTIFNPELPFLIHQKFYFDEQNYRMKKYAHSFRTHWPRYGFIKQFGGFNRLCLSHELAFDDPIHFTIDVSGYDRDICLIEVYDDRTYFLFPGQDFMIRKTGDQAELCSTEDVCIKTHYQWVVKNTLEPVCCMNDGTMFQRPDGNSSGSNNTTVDNCWSHTRICFYLYLRLGVKQFGRILSYSEILANVVKSLYGDDILGTLNKPFWFPDGFVQQEFEDFVRETYALLRLTVKDRAFKISPSLEGLEFLGSTAQWNKSLNAWIPKPRLEKLTTSISQMLKLKSPDVIAASLTTFFDLTALGQTEEEKIVQIFIRNYSSWLLTNYRDHLTNESDIAKLMDIRDRKCSALNIVLGLEQFEIPIQQQSAQPIGGFSFFPSEQQASHIHRKEVGFKKYMMNKNQKKKGLRVPGAFVGGVPSFPEMETEPIINHHQKQQQQQQQQQHRKKSKATWILTETDFCPPGFETLPETLSFAGGIPGGPNFLARNYIGFINEYRNSAHSKGLPIIEDITYDYKMTGMAHIPGWECKATCTYSGLRYKTLTRHSVKKDAQQACARMVSLYIIHQLCRKNKLSNETTVARQDFLDFWTAMQPRFLLLTQDVRKRYEGFVPHVADYYLECDPNELFEDIVDRKFKIFRKKDSSNNPKGWKEDLTADGDVEENPGPTFRSRLGRKLSFYECIFRDAQDNLFHNTQFSTPSALQHAQEVEDYYWYCRDRNSNYEGDFEEDLSSDGDVELNPGPLTKAQYLQKHKLKYDKAGLTPAQRSQRYVQYAQGQSKMRVRPATKKQLRPRRVQGGAVDGSVFNSGSKMVARDQIATFSKRLPKGPPVNMSSCARLYAIGLVNPFSFFDSTDARSNRPMGLGDVPPDLPCLPTFPSLKSRRTKFYIRGTTVSDTNGELSVSYAPRRLANNYATTLNNQCPLILSNGTLPTFTSQFPVLDTGAALTTGYLALNFNSDYTTTNINSLNNVERLVCAGVRIRYAGPDLSRSGIVQCCMVPSHNSLSNQSVVTMSNYETYFRLPVSKKWFTLVYTPVLPGEYQYDVDIIADGFGEDNLLGAANSHFMGIYVTGAAPSTLFEYEACAIMEAVGNNIRGLRLADSDIRGLEMVNNVVRPETQMAINTDGVSSVLNNIIRGAGMLTSIVPSVARAASTIFDVGSMFL